MKNTNDNERKNVNNFLFDQSIYNRDHQQRATEKGAPLSYYISCEIEHG